MSQFVSEGSDENDFYITTIANHVKVSLGKLHCRISMTFMLPYFLPMAQVLTK